MSLGQFEEARLFTTNAERERWETQATLFSVIVSLDFLERAYVRGSVPETESVVLSPTLDSAAGWTMNKGN